MEVNKDSKAQSNAIKSWAEDDRPREKLLLKGRNALSDAELLAIIMGSGSRGESAVSLAKRILTDHQNNWHELAKCEVSELCQYTGIGEAKAISIITALEIGRRRAGQNIKEKVKITSSNTVFEIMNPLLGDLGVEEFWAIYLNQANKVLLKEKISQGGISQTVVDQRRILRKALEKSATAIIIAHNHPSGNLTPSPMDIQITEKIKQSAELMDIKLLDHLIITQTAYYSFADEGKL
ncbi:MAG: DNA repair protein RadC [Weeksellaceae bacterium]|nr:DNA repair protein RadC [Weeksellaceae bacterium]